MKLQVHVVHANSTMTGTTDGTCPRLRVAKARNCRGTEFFVISAKVHLHDLNANATVSKVNATASSHMSREQEQNDRVVSDQNSQLGPSMDLPIYPCKTSLSTRCCKRGAVSAKAHLAVVSWFSVNTHQKKQTCKPTRKGRASLLLTRCCEAFDGRSLNHGLGPQTVGLLFVGPH